MNQTPTDPVQEDDLAAGLADGMADGRRADNLSNLAYRAVLDLIHRRRLRGGQPVVEARLAEQLAISRTPLREALQRLEGEGLIVKEKNRSYQVRHVDLGEYLQALKVREILEPEAAAMAAGHIPLRELAQVKAELASLDAVAKTHTEAHWKSDDNLHELFARYSGNDVLARTIRSMRVTMRLFEIARLDDRVQSDSREHMAIVAALEREEPEGARSAVRTHIRSIGDFAIATVR